MSDITEILLAKRACSVCDGNGFKTDGRHCGGCNGSGETMHYGHVGQRAADEITRLRSQVAEQEAIIRRLQDRASKDHEHFSTLIREAREEGRNTNVHN